MTLSIQMRDGGDDRRSYRTLAWRCLRVFLYVFTRPFML